MTWFDGRRATFVRINRVKVHSMCLCVNAQPEPTSQLLWFIGDAKCHTRKLSAHRDSRQYNKKSAFAVSQHTFSFFCPIQNSTNKMNHAEDDEIIEEVNRIVSFSRKKRKLIVVIWPFPDSRVFVETASQQFVRVSVSEQKAGAIAGRRRSSEELRETHSSGGESRLCVGYGITALWCVQRWTVCRCRRWQGPAPREAVLPQRNDGPTEFRQHQTNGQCEQIHRRLFARQRDPHNHSQGGGADATQFLIFR